MKLKALYILGLKSFERLNAILRVFNPFRILKVNDYEIRHSNMLAWFLAVERK
jgi:hypothetical protein